ncbi:CRISPR-associated helicase Cas3' [Oenococcus sicerae]|uniref:CRISPR-associated helicase Cas3 n=1 Tax=Oenococcus sicerae TaxID=2203724 RepID=A0ABX5QP57_9LACO|nr:CRISPR-associated helicase Cas3' [Oenococcus sicerae]
MDRETRSLWAKKKTSDGQQQWLPLIAHLTDTAMVINLLYNHWLSENQRRILAKDSSEENARKLAKFVAFIHDIGKATPAFQLKPSYDGNRSLDHELLEQLISAGFAGMDTIKLSSPGKSPHAKAGEAILESFGVPDTVGAIVGGHHGRPLSFSPADEIQTYTANYWQSDKDKLVQDRWKRVQSQILNYSLRSAGFDEVSDIPSLDQTQAVILEGLLIMSDWLSSSEYLDNDVDKPLFPLIALDQPLESIDESVRVERAWNTWQVNDEWQPKKISMATDAYQQRWGFSARPVQRSVTKAISDMEDPGIVVVEAPMGLGKTEIALVAAEQLAYKSGSNGLFFGLPTQATSNAMFERVNTWLNFLSQTVESTLSIKLMHGKAQFNEDFQSIPNAANVDSDSSVVVNSWFSGKKSILDEFSVGTIDNLLLMALKQKHLALKHLGFSKKVVVIDEVHAYDTYMNQYLDRAIEWLGAYHVPTVILSATLPKDKRNQLVAKYFHGKYGKSIKRLGDFSSLMAGWEKNEAYPLVTILDGKELKQVSDFPGMTDQLPQRIQVQRVIDDDDKLIAHILASIEGGGVAGVIVNTVKRAQMLAKKIPDNVRILVLHSAFLAPERVKLERELQSTIGKNGDRPLKMVVIGTQVLEQSLDIDFDILYTDIAPMDLLLQRAGRLHRHQRARPSQLENPTMVLMGAQSLGKYSDANKAVYGQYLLLKTDYYLPNTLRLPTDISHLVQLVYDFEKDPSSIDGMKEAKTDFETQMKKEKAKASVFQISPPNLKNTATIHGWLDRAQMGVDTNDQQAAAAVRDINETLEIILVQDTKTGFYLLDGTKLEESMLADQAKMIAQQVVRLPTVFSYKIEKTITELEKITAKLFPMWQDNKWLRGSLVLPLDQDLSCVLLNYRLTYSQKYGLSYLEEESKK